MNQSPYRVFLVLSCAALFTVISCGDSSDPSSPDPATSAAFRDAGPWAVGVRTLQLPDRDVEIWYPVAPADVEGLDKYEYFIRDALPQFVDDILAPDVNPPFETDAYRDVPASGDGPFPLILFAHGFASYRNQSTFLTAHLASWGFVVASTDYFNRALATVLSGGGGDDEPTDTELSRSVVDLLKEENVRSGGPLEGRVSAERIAIIGHSAGGGTARVFGDESDVVTYVPLSAGSSSNPDFMIDFPDKASLWLTGTIDGIVEVERVEAAYEEAPAPKRLLLLDGGGHLAPSDICQIGEDGGGVIAIAIEAGLGDLLPESFRALGTDGCQEEALDILDGWPTIRHFVTAHMRWAFGIDSEPSWEGDQIAGDLPEATFTYREDVN